MDNVQLLHAISEMMDRKFEEKFEPVYRKFDAIDKRFDQVDERFDRLEGRIEVVEGKIAYPLLSQETV